MNKTLSLFISLIFTSSLALSADLWTEGRKASKRRVNQSLKHLSPKAYVNVAEAVGPAVVNISTTTVVKNTPFQSFQFRGKRNGKEGNPFGDFFGDDFFERFFGSPGAPTPEGQQRQQSLGSGFILNKDGYVVTNSHVVEKADEIKVILSDETEFDAKVIGSDAKTDVALLKIKSNKRFPSVILGDSNAMKVGDVVVAIGNPFGLSHSTTQGIVSAKERSIGHGAYDDFIQTDASINPGNSGGPLLNIHGEVIGINTAIFSRSGGNQGIGFAIPINLAKGILSKLKKDGKVIRGWLGVLIQKVTEDHAKALKLGKRQGALISSVVKDSPAKDAGIQPGDVILKFNGKSIKDWHQLPILVANVEIGKTVPVEISRDGKRKTLRVKIAKAKEEKKTSVVQEASKTDKLGLKVKNLDENSARTLGVDVTKGVYVSEIDRSSAAFAKGIRRGDVILELNRKKVSSVADYRRATKGIKKGSSVLVLVKRREQTIFIAFSL